MSGSDAEQPPLAGTGGSLRVDSSDVKSSYANVCTVNMTREEVILNFGINQDWDRAGTGVVKLEHRVIVSPQAAKQILALMERVMADYEARFGALT
jgi:hypothetical protein